MTLYNMLVNQLIRERYTEADEIAILRQRDTKPAEFAEYNNYCEECKAKARIDVPASSEVPSDEQ